MRSGLDNVVDGILASAPGAEFQIPNVQLPSEAKGGPLQKGSRKAIRECGIYWYARQNCFRIHAYDGQLKQNGRLNKLTVLSGQADKETAKRWADAWVVKIDAAWVIKYGAEAEERWSGDLPSTSAPEGSLEYRILERMENMRAEKGAKNATYRNYLTEVREILKLFGPLRLRRRPEQLTPPEITSMVEHRIKKLDPDTASVRQTMTEWRTLLRGILTEECHKAIKAPKRTGARGRGTAPANSDDYPFEDEELRIIIAKLPVASDTVNGLFHIGACGTMNTIDAVLAKWSHFDEIKQNGKARRKKNRNPFRYGVSNGFRAWLEAREKKRKKNDVYIFPELVFTQEQLKDPECNTKPLEDEDEVAASARTRTNEVFGEFLREICKITREGVSFRSFRHYNVSQLVRAKVPERFIKWLVGHLGEGKSLERYIHPLPVMTAGVNQCIQAIYHAVAEGRELPVFLNDEQMLEAFGQKMKSEMKQLKREIMEEFRTYIRQAMQEERTAIADAVFRRLLDNVTGLKSRGGVSTDAAGTLDGHQMAFNF